MKEFLKKQVPISSVFTMFGILLIGQFGMCYYMIEASNVSYNNTISELSAGDVQGAIDEIDQTLDQNNKESSAQQVLYDNKVSRLNAKNVQEALDQLDLVVDGNKKAIDEIWAYLLEPLDKYNSNAESAGRNAKTAQEVYYQDYDEYVNQLNGLLKVDRNLTDDTQVTFSFYGTSLEGYTYATSHFQGNVSYRWTE